MAAVEDAQPHAVEVVVVFAAKPLATLVVLPNPSLKALFDLLQLVARGFGFLRVDDAGFGPRVGVVNGRRFEIQRVLDQLQRRVAARSPFGRVRDSGASAVVTFYEPSADCRRVGDGDAFVAE